MADIKESHVVSNSNNRADAACNLIYCPELRVPSLAFLFLGWHCCDTPEEAASSYTFLSRVMSCAKIIFLQPEGLSLPLEIGPSNLFHPDKGKAPT